MRASSLFTLVVVLAVVGSRFHGAAKALTSGAAAGLGFGLQAAVTKTFVTELGNGILALLGSWSVYILILSAVRGFVLQQSALKTGCAGTAMASSNSVTLFWSVILGIVVYGERLAKSGAGHVSSAGIGLLIAIAASAARRVGGAAALWNLSFRRARSLDHVNSPEVT